MCYSVFRPLAFPLLSLAGQILGRVSSLTACVVGLAAFGLVILLCSSLASAASATLAWDVVTAPELAGYKLHYGSASRNYGFNVNAGKSTTAAVSGLEEGKVYYFAVTAYDASGKQSGFSNEVSYKVPELDSDGDGLTDREETQTYSTDPKKADSDGDGLSDGDEIKLHQTDPKRVDTDGDGLSDRDEVKVYKSNPTRNDTDGDGTPDGIEVSEGSNPLDPKSIPLENETVFAVNAGGAQYVDATGVVYQGDARFSGGSTFTTTAAIAGTTDDRLYQTSRYGNFSYAIPVPNGDYLVTLKFTEVSYTKVGQRVFDVLMEGAEVLNNLDLVDEVGPKVAYDVTLPVHVTDGVLNIGFRSVVNSAKVNGIVIMGGTGTL